MVHSEAGHQHAVIIGKKAFQNLYHLTDTMIATTNGSTKKNSEVTDDANLSYHMPKRFVRECMGISRG